MSRFLILFNAPEPMVAFMQRSTPEERQAGMEAWTAWKTEADKTIAFEFGNVVQAVGRLDSQGASEAANQAANYAFAEADSKEAVIDALQGHPHLKRDGATIDVLEVLSMPR